jgi:tetratricopeptide (TPR) repeat protein
MNAAQIHNQYKLSVQFLSKGELKNAFQKTQLLVDELQIGEFTDRLDELKQNYTYLLHYFVDGVEDPQRKTVYNKLISKCFSLNSDLREELLLRNSSNYEFTQKRYFPHTRHHQSANELSRALHYFHSQTALLSEPENSHKIEFKRLRSNYEFNLTELFRVVWLTSKFSVLEKQLVTQLTDENYLGWVEKSVCISALTLNLWRTFDESKLILLLDACLSADNMVRQRALVGLCFVLIKYNAFISYFPAIRNRLVLLSDDNHIVENFQNIFIQIIGTDETDKISKKMQEEILPEMIKISPLMKDKMDADSVIGSEEWEEANPDWQAMLDESGVTDKLKELNEMQKEGADVYMSTFSLLKSFPFFSEFANWFLPFDSKHSSVNELFKIGDTTLFSAFVRNNVMCNSDKYSFCLSILQMPESQRANLTQSFKMEAEQLEEMTNEDAILAPVLVSKNTSKQYIQDLFRFFKLNPEHSAFSDMFSYALLIHRSFLFDVLASNSDFSTKIAEYYFVKNHYAEALDLFEKNLSLVRPSAALYQKIGYCYQQTSHLQMALEAYIKADIIQPDDNWTIRKIALCYRLSGNYQKALEYYQHSNFLKPEQSQILLQIGQCQSALGNYKDALSVYFQLDAESPDNPKYWRAIAWCAFVSGNMKSAIYYSDKLVEAEPEAQNFLNAGHIAWCQKRKKDAIHHYQKCLQELQNDWKLFIEMFNKDKTYLISNGISTDDIPLLLDAVYIHTNDQVI